MICTWRYPQQGTVYAYLDGILMECTLELNTVYSGTSLLIRSHRLTGCHRLSQAMSQAVTGYVTGCHRLSQAMSQAATGCHRLSQAMSQAATGCHRLSQVMSQAVTGYVTGCHRLCHRLSQAATGCHRLSQAMSQAVTGCHRLSQAMCLPLWIATHAQSRSETSAISLRYSMHVYMKIHTNGM